MLTWIAAGLIGAGGGAWAVGRMLAPRQKAGVQEKAGALEAVDLTPVSFETQEVARWLAYEDQPRQAISKVTEEGTLSRDSAKVAVDALLADRTLPTSYEKAATVLYTQRPELAERARGLDSEGRRTEAIRALREETGVGLLVAAQLLEAPLR